ncbi:putative defensin-like protein 230 [Raphanus sativus]|uniref:Defensin-like protein 230 n=1 Tax=Raphanus sativus TaxID=3726 RepID=A0A9W3D961_RAPSA|nr:putative defensin-like protein 230 [Raphanus sativus]
MRSATWFNILFLCVWFIKFLKEHLPEKYCPRIEDIEGNCKDNGLKVCAKFMTSTYKMNYFNCTCNNINMLHKIKRYCECQSLCSDHPPPSPIHPPPAPIHSR